MNLLSWKAGFEFQGFAMACSATKKKKYFYDSIMADSLTFVNLIG